MGTLAKLLIGRALLLNPSFVYVVGLVVKKAKRLALLLAKPRV
jgi:hypothetical protein